MKDLAVVDEVQKVLRSKVRTFQERLGPDQICLDTTHSERTFAQIVTKKKDQVRELAPLPQAQAQSAQSGARDRAVLKEPVTGASSHSGSLTVLPI